MLTPVAALKMGDAIGNDNRTLYVVVSTPERHPQTGVVSATIVFPPDEAGGEPRVERRTWLHGHAAAVHVRPRRQLSEDELRMVRDVRELGVDPTVVA